MEGEGEGGEDDGDEIQIRRTFFFFFSGATAARQTPRGTRLSQEREDDDVLLVNRTCIAAVSVKVVRSWENVQSSRAAHLAGIE